MPAAQVASAQIIMRLSTLSATRGGTAASLAAVERVRSLSSFAGADSDWKQQFQAKSSLKQARPSKRLVILRHGQAQHNPRAELAREHGCDFDEFLRLMEEDDALDATLTQLGEDQARTAGESAARAGSLSNIELVVSSPLSRAIQTADLVLPPSPNHERKCVEDFREINGKLLNAKRLPSSELQGKFGHWCFENIPEQDESWTPDLESRDACGQRGYSGLAWILQQHAENVLLCCHGGLLSYTLNSNEKVVLIDSRDAHERERCITKRFGNCEMREFIATAWQHESGGGEVPQVITLEEVSFSSPVGEL